jgi:hypothetical protein
MSTRRNFDAVEHERVARPPQSDTPDLFSQPAENSTPPAWSTSGEQDIERQIERMAAIARELGEKAGDRGLTISDVRITAENRGVLTGEERGRRLSYLGTVMKRAGLEPTEEFRRSDVPRSNGNLHRVYRMRAA